MNRKNRVHNEWFQTTVAMKCDCGSNRKSRLASGHDVQVWIWGEYVYGKWRTVRKVCESCFASEVIPRLVNHADLCGCSFDLCSRSGYGPLASWIALPASLKVCAA